MSVSTVTKHVGEGFGKGELARIFDFDTINGVETKDMRFNTSYRQYFRDTGLSIYSSADGQLDIVADTTLALSGAMTLDNTFNMTVTTAETDPGRQVYWQFTSTAVASGKQLQGIQIKASWGGTANSTGGGVTGAEIKARASGDSITHRLGQARAIVANVDAKKATFDIGYCVEAAMDIASGGTITSGAAFRAYLNNSGTLTTGYAFLVAAESGYPWTYGLYIPAGMATTGILSLAPVTVGVDGTGYDVIFYGDTVGKYLTYDADTYTLHNRGAAKFHNRPLTTNVFAVEIKADTKNSTGVYTGALQVTVREYPTTDTSAVSVNGSDFTTYLHAGDTKTAGYLTSIVAKVENQGTFNGAGIIMTPIYSLIGETGTFTAVNHVCGLWLDSHLDSTITAGSFEMLFMTNNGDTQMDAAMYLIRSRVTNFVTFAGSGAMISATAETGGTSKKIKIDIDGTTYYINAYTG